MKSKRPFYVISPKTLLLAIPFSMLSIYGLFAFCESLVDPAPAVSLSLTDALYVTDREITKIYGPGTCVQQSILEQITTQVGVDEMSFTQPFVYRMGLDPGDSNEGILLMNFSPDHPEMARLLSQR